MKAIINSNIVLNDSVLENSVLVFDEKIRSIVKFEDYNSNKIEKEIDAKGNYLFPGFIDLHIHGFAGFDVMDEEPNALATISREILKTGVTSFLPTTMTMDLKRIENSLKNIKYMMKKRGDFANVRGAHLEGPFISKAFKGAQNAKYIIKPNEEFIENNLECIKIITIAPEVEEAISVIKKFKDKVIFSIGHSESDYETAISAIDAGAKHSTHTFNAMTGIHHRKPGIVSAVLLRDDVNAEIIADKIHTHQAILELIFKVKTSNSLVLITDSMRAGGMKDGEYSLGGQKVIVKDNSARLEDGTLAGSVLTMDKACKHMYEIVGANLSDIARMSSYNPAKIIGLESEIGSIDIGKNSDLVILNKRFEIEKTIIDGNIVFEK